MKELKEKIKVEIKRIFKEETEAGRFSILKEEDVDLLAQIVMSEVLIKKIKSENFRAFDEHVERRSADLIFIAAPTGAGKDTLVRKIAHDNPEKKYVVLNMDMFRSYYIYFKQYLLEKYPQGLTDRTFATQTNGFSYEIYYTIQRLILENFPGTDVIITGTIREIDWVEETFRVFKADTYTEYTTKMYGLAVPKKICAISAIERYLYSIKRYAPGTARYVSSEYYSDTTDNYIKNFGYFEEMVASKEGILDVIEVYKRSARQNDFNEDTMLYTSDVSRRKHPNITMTAKQVVAEIINYDADIGLLKLASLLDRIALVKDYLMEQGLYKEVLCAVHEFASKETGRKPSTMIEKQVEDKMKPTGSGVGGDDGETGKYPGCDD